MAVVSGTTFSLLTGRIVGDSPKLIYYDQDEALASVGALRPTTHGRSVICIARLMPHQKASK